MANLKSRIDRLETTAGPRDHSPIVAMLECLGGRDFTRKTLRDYIRNTHPGAAHPVRRLISYVYMDCVREARNPAHVESSGHHSVSVPPTRDVESAILAGELAVRELDELIVKGEIPWLPEAIEEWEATHPVSRLTEYTRP